MPAAKKRKGRWRWRLSSVSIPLILMACVFRVPLGTDKLSLAGGVLGNPIPVVKTKTAEITIPAYAEIVIEGFIDPRGKEEDGVLGESSGYYIALPNSPTIHVTAVTYRKSGYFHAIMPWGSEVDHLLSFRSRDRFHSEDEEGRSPLWKRSILFQRRLAPMWS